MIYSLNELSPDDNNNHLNWLTYHKSPLETFWHCDVLTVDWHNVAVAKGSHHVPSTSLGKYTVPVLRTEDNYIIIFW